MKTTLEFILAGAAVKRYHTVTTLMTETVGHHSHGVALLCMLLDPNPSRGLILAALLHDLAEHQTGDIPSPAKHKYGIGDQVSELEDKLLREAGLGMPQLHPEDNRILKLADVAQGALFCIKEMSLGNSNMRSIFNRYVAYAEEMMLYGREKELFNLIKEMASECK
jgi:5'-deoxynucleotidase YfbR-like HD superfamily hydrolase